MPTVRICFTLAALLALLPAQAFAIEYGGIGGRPAFPRPDVPRSDSIFIHTVETGQVIEEGISVINNTDTERTLLVYAADSTPSTGGGFACKQLLETQTGVGTWITLSAKEITLAPNTNQIIPFTIHVPSNAGVGEHNGCVLVQEKSQAEADGTQSGMQLSLRTGLRVALTVAGDLKRDVRIVSFKGLSSQAGRGRLHVSLFNAGNVSTDTTLSIETTSLLGQPFFTHTGTFSIMRDEQADYTFELPKSIWGGRYTAALTASYKKTAAQDSPTVTIDGGRVTFYLLPSVPGLLIELGTIFLVLAILIALLLRKKRRKTIARTWKKYRLKSAIPIQDLAKRMGVSWKKIAKANKLKSPYTIRAGDTLLLPPVAKRHTKSKSS